MMAATFAELPEEDQATYLAFLRLMRGRIGEQGRLNNALEVIKTFYLGQVASIHADLDTDDIVIPNDTGLAGATALTKAEVTSLVTGLNNILTYNSDANRQLWMKAAGAENLIG